MRPEEITLAIFEKYTPVELTTTAQEMAQAVSDMETAEAEKKTSDGVFNERIKTHAAKVSKLAQRYNKGGETAQIGCKIRYDIPVVGKKSYVRMDTEETVEVHDMSLGEKQETIQFPLSMQMSDTQKDEAPQTPKAPEPTPEPEPKAAAAITFKDIQAIARNLVKVEAGKRDDAIADMTKQIATQLLAQASAIGPDGKVWHMGGLPIVAEKTAKAWLELAVQQELKPPAEEVTRLCPYPGCIDFADHDGDHRFPPTDAAPADAALEPQPEQQKKPRTRKPWPTAEPGAPA
jgi:hypothetical protein